MLGIRPPFLPLALGVLVFGPLLGSTWALAEEGVLEQIVVTATKRDTNQQTTSVAVTAFTDVDLSAAQVSDLGDLALKTPGLFVGGENNFGGSPVTIRGIGSLNLSIGADEAVGIYVDGVYLGKPYGNLFDFIDVDRVEVLRGPQGTLYGRNATGGAILINTITPSETTILRADATVTNLGGIAGRALASGALVPGTLYGKFAAGGSSRDGYSYNPSTGQRLNSSKTHLFSGALRWTPGENWDVALRAYQGIRDGTITDKNIIDHLPLDTVPSAYPSISNKSFRGATLNATAQLGSVTFSSVTGYTDADTLSLNAAASNDLVQFRTGTWAHEWYQEFRLASVAQSPLTWLVGVNAFHESAENKTDFAVLPVPIGMNFYSRLTTKSYAAFLEGTYHFTPVLSLTAGGRYTHDEKDWRNCNLAGAYTNIEIDWRPGLCDGLYLHDSNAWNAVTPHVSVDARFTEQLFAYVSATKGFRSGGWNFTEAVSGPNSGVDPENVWSYEAGLKSEWLEHRVRGNLAIFLADYTDLQVRSVNPVNNLLVLSNAATARIKGVELEVLTRPVAALEVSLAASLTDAKYREFTYVLNGVDNDFSGKYLSSSPKWQAALTADYVFSLPGGATVTPRIELVKVGTTYFDQSNTFPQAADAHEMVNVRLRYAAPGGQWGLQLFVENATDQREPTYAYQGLTPEIVASKIPPPRIYGAQVFVDL